jgi:hypothetical protein
MAPTGLSVICMARRDFTKPRDTIEFTIDADTFTAVPAIPAGVMIDAAAKMDSIDNATVAEQCAALTDILQMCLEEQSYERFTARMNDRANPVDTAQLMDVVMWLFEEYGLRPTQPSEPSSDGLSDPGSGTTSTDTPPSVELISASSPSIGS